MIGKMIKRMNPKEFTKFIWEKYKNMFKNKKYKRDLENFELKK